MKTLFITFFVGVCCFLAACNLQTGHNRVEKGEKTVAFKLDSVETYYWVQDEIDSELDKVLAEFQKAVQVDPRAEAYKNLGASYLKLGKLDEAIVELTRAIQINPSFVEAHYLLADVYSIKGKGVLSRAFLDRAMALEGSYIIDTKIGIVHETIPIELGPPTVIESTEPTEIIFPPEFFHGPIQHRNLDPVDQPQKR